MAVKEYTDVEGSWYVEGFDGFVAGEYPLLSSISGEASFLSVRLTMFEAPTIEYEIEEHEYLNNYIESTNTRRQQITLSTGWIPLPSMGLHGLAVSDPNSNARHGANVYDTGSTATWQLARYDRENSIYDLAGKKNGTVNPHDVMSKSFLSVRKHNWTEAQGVTDTITAVPLDVFRTYEPDGSNGVNFANRVVTPVYLVSTDVEKDPIAGIKYNFTFKSRYANASI
jgi:hypothetical protein